MGLVFGGECDTRVIVVWRCNVRVRTVGCCDDKDEVLDENSIRERRRANTSMVNSSLNSL